MLEGILVDWCLSLLENMHKNNVHILFMTARNEQFRGQTLAQLRTFVNFPFELYMRRYDDLRADWEVKENFMSGLLERFDILFSLDDNLENCKMFSKYCPSLQIVT